MGANPGAEAEARTREWGMRQMAQNEAVSQKVAAPPRINRPGLATNLVSHNRPSSFLIRPRISVACPGGVSPVSLSPQSFPLQWTDGSLFSLSGPTGQWARACRNIAAGPWIPAASLRQRCRESADRFGASSYGVPQNATVCINFGETPGTQLARSNLHSTGFGMLRYDSAVFERTRDPENRHGHIRL